MKNEKWKIPQSGFTLIELILVVSIISIISALYFSVGGAFLTRNNFQNVLGQFSSSLRIAHINSMLTKEGGTWGVRVEGGNIITFLGASYQSRDPGFDQIVNYPSVVAISPDNSEVVFDNLTGNTEPITFTLSSGVGESAQVSINEVGVVDVN